MWESEMGSCTMKRQGEDDTVQSAVCYMTGLTALIPHCMRRFKAQAGLQEHLRHLVANPGRGNRGELNQQETMRLVDTVRALGKALPLAVEKNRLVLKPGEPLFHFPCVDAHAYNPCTSCFSCIFVRGIEPPLPHLFNPALAGQGYLWQIVLDCQRSEVTSSASEMVITEMYGRDGTHALIR